MIRFELTLTRYHDDGDPQRIAAVPDGVSAIGKKAFSATMQSERLWRPKALPLWAKKRSQDAPISRRLSSLILLYR